MSSAASIVRSKSISISMSAMVIGTVGLRPNQRGGACDMNVVLTIRARSVVATRMKIASSL